jgi:hypothetical protein
MARNAVALVLASAPVRAHWLIASACLLGGCNTPGTGKLPPAAIGQDGAGAAASAAAAEQDTSAEPVELVRNESPLEGRAFGAKRHGLSFDELAQLHGLEAVAGAPEWGAESSDPALARDDDLLTAWTCDPRGEGPCAYGLSFGAPVQLRALRLYAAAGPDYPTYSSHPRLQKVRIHTDAGSSTATIPDGAGHRYLVLDRPVRTSSVTIEVLSTQGGSSGPVHVAEIEAIGSGGEPRAPLELDPKRAYVNYVNSDWKKNESGHYIVRQAFLEFDRPGSTPLRFMRATAIFGLRGDRFLLLERVYKTNCATHGGSYVLLDTQNRTYFALGPMGGVPGEVFRHEDGYGFAIGHQDLRDLRSAVFTGKSVERKVFPKNARDQPSEYLDAWNMEASAMPRGGHRVEAPPKNCSAASEEERGLVADAIGAGPDEAVLHCNIEHGGVVLARGGVAVVDDGGKLVASQEFEDPGRYEPRAQTVGLGDDEVEVEMFVETRSKSGAVQVLRVHDGGIDTLADDTALALRPPHTCGRAGSFETVRAAPGSEREDADQD